MVRRKLSFSVRLSPVVLDELDKLIPEKYSSRSDLVNRAIIELIHREQIRPVLREEVKQLLVSDEGRALLRAILCEEDLNNKS